MYWVVTSLRLHILSYQGFLPFFLWLQFRKEILSVQIQGIQRDSFWFGIESDAHCWSEKEKQNKTPNVNDLRAYCWTSTMCGQARTKWGRSKHKSNGNTSMPFCQIVLFNIVKLSHQQWIILKVSIISDELIRRNSRVWATEKRKAKLGHFFGLRVDSSCIECVHCHAIQKRKIKVKNHSVRKLWYYRR